MPLHEIHWHQRDSAMVFAWEFQFQRPGGGWEWVSRTEPVDGCAECFTAVVEVPRTAILVRSRSVGAGGESAWSAPLPMPEPSVTTALLVSLLAMLLAHRRQG
jgi:hypothetical protein